MGVMALKTIKKDGNFQKSGIFFVLIILFLFAFSLATLNTSHAATPLYVNGTSGNDTYDGTSPTWVSGIIGPKKTIQNGSDSVSVGGTVNIAEGNYQEHVTISKNLSLIGSGQTKTFINGTNNGRVITILSGISVNITGVTITNGSSNFGAGITNNGNLTITNSTITSNVYDGSGGPIFGEGSGIWNLDSTLNVINCNITNNSARSGAGIFNRGTLNVISTTISRNTATIDGAAVTSYLAGNVNITDCTITNNSASLDAVIKIAPKNSGVTQTINYCRFANNTPGSISISPTYTLDARYNWWCSNSDPSHQFGGTVNYSPWLYMTLTANPNFILNGATSTLTASFNNAYDGSTVTSIDPASGHIPDGSAVTFTTDFGSVGSKTTTKNTDNGVATATLTADEGTGTAHISAQLDSQTLNTVVEIETLYVNGATGNDSWDGTSPTFISGTIGPMKTIQIAVNAITSGGKIYVAIGTYYEHITIPKSLSLIGANRDNTIIDGTNNGRVINLFVYNGITVMISNFIIRNGAISGTGIDSGGAIVNGYNNILTINNVTITGNNATQYGGAIANDGIVTITNSTLSGNNVAINSGGAIYNTGTLTITNSTITANNAIYDGGAIYNNLGTVNISNSTLNGNNAEGGGAIYNQNGILTINNSTLNGNNVTNPGGAIYTRSGTATITNSTINGNNATSGGAIFIYSGTATITNSTLNANHALGGGAIENSGTLTIINSTINGNNATNYGGAIQNYNGQLTITQSTLNGNNATQYGGALYSSGTLTITQSTLNGNNATNYGGAIYNMGAVTMHFNRLANNSPDTIWTNKAINATNNWWGSNFNPSSQFAGTGTVDYSPWLYMTLTANPTLILNGGTSQLTASFNNAYNGTVITPINPASGHLPDGSVVTFTTDLGSVGSPTTTKNTSNGSAIATLTADAGIGTANITAVLDSQTLTTTVGITDTLYVNGATGNDDWNGLSPTYISGHTGPMATIRTALEAIIRDGTINVASGTYTEDLTINQNINLTGNGTTNSIITPRNPTDNIITITRDVTKAIISGFTIQGATNGNGVLIQGNDITLKNNSIVGNGNGITVDKEIEKIVIIQNNIMDNKVGIDTSSDKIKINFNRISHNDADISTKLEGIDATDNWWGSNDDPSGRVSGGVNVNPWLVLTVNTTPTLIKKDATSNITADLNHDSDGSTITGHVMDGILITFTTTLGTINSPKYTQNGTTNTTLHGGSVSGVADITTTVDNEEIHTPVTVDATAPTVTSTNPAQYAVNLPSNQVFTVTFSEAIKAANVNLVVLKTSTGTVIATTKSITGNVLTITPNIALNEAKYLLLLYAGCVTDLAGNPAAALSRTYSVGAQPYVTSTDPANYATNVPRNKVITATFNEPILAKYLTLIYLKTVTGGIQVATIKSVSGNTLTITPTTPLAANTRYMLLIYTFAVTDIYGNSNVNKAITFTTGAT
jgi:predicted outer membrane repeat protein